MTSTSKITVLIPCFNEEQGIADVLTSFPTEKARINGYELQCIVIDNNSSDRTAEIARAHGATVLYEPKKGKGNALRLGIDKVSEDTDFIVMLDGDDTYRASELLRLIEPLESGFSDVVIGSRLGGRIGVDSMTSFNRFGNLVFTHLVRIFYRVNVTDVLTGYFAWKREALMRLRPHLTSQGFAIEMEMITKMAQLGEEITSVPISYDSRAGDSSLNPISDGVRILGMFLKNLLWQPQVQRIAFVSDAVMPFHKGGKEKRLYEISRRLVQEGREVHIYTMKWWEGPKVIQEDGVYFHALCKLHPLYSGERRSMVQAIWFSLATFKLLFASFDVLDVDHIPFFPIFSARIVTWLRGKKLYATWHEVWGKDYWMEYLNGPQGWIGYIIEELSFKLPDVIISNSWHTTRRLQQASVRCAIKTIPPGADLEEIYNTIPSNQESDVIMVGRFLKHKNVELFVKAMGILKENIPDIRGVIVGDGPEKSAIRTLIKSLGLQGNIKIVDRIEHNIGIYSLMKASKLLVLPSVREGFSMVVVEAHAAGLPVITTSHQDNAAKDLIREGVNGYLVQPNEHEIAQKIQLVLDNPDLMSPQQGIEQHDWKNVMQNIELSWV
ncbi:glycosyltransferase [Patescibacteria group bacterium]|nr:glycosyltransferase [Patescibacteria group bacterium]